MTSLVRSLLRLTQRQDKMAPSVESERDPTSEKAHYMDFYVGLCRVMGMWPRDTYNFVLYYAMFFSILIIDFIMILSMFREIFFHSSDLDGLAEVVDYATAYTSAFYRYIYAIFMKKKFIELIDFMHTNFAHTSFGPGRKLSFNTQVKVTRYICFSYILLIQVWLAHAIIGPVIYNLRSAFESHGNDTYGNDTLGEAEEMRLPVMVRVVVQDSEHPNMLLSQVLHIFSFYTMAYVYSFTDVFWFALLILTTGQFELITHSLRSIRARFEEAEEDEDEEEAGGGKESVREIEEVVDACMTQHQLTREFAYKMESLFHPLVLVDFLHAVISISFMLMDATIAINNMSIHKLFVIGEYLLVSMFHMWVMDYFGNELTFREQEISSAVYEIPWYNYPKRLRSKVLVMVTLARNPCKITGGKLYTVSLEFFAGTVRTIFSYLMILLQLREM